MDDTFKTSNVVVIAVAVVLLGLGLAVSVALSVSHGRDANRDAFVACVAAKNPAAECSLAVYGRAQ